MAECQNCGSHVSQRYVRVAVPENVDQPRVCPDCPDKVRRDGKVREKKSHRGSP